MGKTLFELFMITKKIGLGKYKLQNKKTGSVIYCFEVFPNMIFSENLVLTFKQKVFP